MTVMCSFVTQQLFTGGWRRWEFCSSLGRWLAWLDYVDRCDRGHQVYLVYGREKAVGSIIVSTSCCKLSKNLNVCLSSSFRRCSLQGDHFFGSEGLELADQTTLCQLCELSRLILSVGPVRLCYEVGSCATLFHLSSYSQAFPHPPSGVEIMGYKSLGHRPTNSRQFEVNSGTIMLTILEY